MRVLVACEFSGRVRDAFLAAGHDATSCDLLPSEQPGPHYQGDVRDILGDGWDLMVGHAACTYLARSGARWWPERWAEQREAIAFFRLLMVAPIKRIAIENPVGIISTTLAKPTQIIQPWMFGHGETKATCLWLQELPPLVPEDVVEGREQRLWRLPPGPNRWKERSRTYPGIALAMARQWGSLS